MISEVEVRPLSRPPDATVTVPGSKSITNRALLLAAMAKGTSKLDGILQSDDTRYMAEALRQLGAPSEAYEGGQRLRVVGQGGTWPVREADLFVGNAGTAMRFLLAALSLGNGRFRIDGSLRMRQRPIRDLVETLGELGVRASCELGTDGPPVIVEAAGLSGGSATIGGSESSQFLSAILQVSPHASHDVTIGVRGELIAQPYVDMTIAVMEAFGAEVERDGYREFHVRGGQSYRARDYTIEPDASSAHYFLAAAALTGGRVRVSGLGRDSLQGDIRFAEVLAAMGASVDWQDDGVVVTGSGRLDGIEIDMNAISDTALTLATLAPFAEGPVRIRNVAHLRRQESDRLHAAATELTRLGVTVRELSDGLEVHPSRVVGTSVRTYDDHRIAMSFSLIGLRIPGVRILEPECVSKTFPDFFDRLEALRR